MEQAIIAVLREQASATHPQISAALTARGQQHTSKSLRTRLALLARFGVIERKHTGSGGGVGPTRDETVWGLPTEQKAA